MYTGPIIDAHQHFWEPDINPHPWLAKDAQIPFRYGDYNAIKRRYLPPDYLADAARHRIVASVYIDAEWDPSDPIGETQYIHQVAQKYGFPNAVVAQAWLHHDNAEELLAAQAQWPLVRSVRHKPGGAITPDEAKSGVRSLMSDERWRQGFDLLKKHNLHFDLQTPWWHLDEAAILARDFPETQIILNHTGLPADRSVEGLTAWRKAIEKVAQYENVAVKISGLGQEKIPWNVENNRQIVLDTIAIFGAERAMFASNFPVDSLCVKLDVLWQGFKIMVKDLTARHQNALFYENARRIYNINVEYPFIAPVTLKEKL
ncbi:amidohydrolase family protein [Salmonella enterica]|uniref:Thioesterase n=4 Tax=Salmonella enterica TaxID=28901 RepID=A0A3Z6QTD9_SALEB|nr:amidohydrolase family protein [Salmonella sp. SG203]EAA1979822.1 thioesterase [Salmonella enterica subsp. enterica serovar Java]EAA2594895.1 thioesterase [Salmonella enterica subsp. enterica serovar Poona]EAN9729144.1 thioesterase [Salmonella enterica]EBH3381919.1 thioesterase [Salmonella enterica subsp. enterica serovar Infantis]EBQ9442758.1 thioesterase [Salmonella enterica subsp. enterica serovar Cerro]EBU6735289.1 thioesterase [Salmonella enterica subsp. enterica serovar Adelaide]EBV7